MIRINYRSRISPDEQSEDEAIDDRIPRHGNNNHVDYYEPLPIMQNEQQETYAEIFQRT